MKCLYVCFAIDPQNIEENRITSASPAAFVKVLSVCEGMTLSGIDVSILSVGIFNSSKKNAVLTDKIINSIPISYIKNYKNKFFRVAYTMFTLPKYIKHFTPDVVIFYNYGIEYFCGLNYCKRHGIKCIVDIEDGLMPELGVIRYFYRNFLLTRYIKQSKSNIFTVCTTLAKKAEHSLVIYGTGKAQNKKEKNNDKINFLFCGSLIKETGAELIIDLIKILKNMPLTERIFINICGFGYCEKSIKDVCASVDFATYWGTVSREKYENLLSISDVGIVLRLVGNTMSETTFPSKIVELSLSNLGLITTPVSDIPKLFSSNEVYFVNSLDDIVSVIEAIVADRKNFMEKRELLFKRACELFDKKSIGQQVLNFIQEM